MGIDIVSIHFSTLFVGKGEKQGVTLKKKIDFEVFFFFKVSNGIYR